MLNRKKLKGRKNSPSSRPLVSVPLVSHHLLFLVVPPRTFPCVHIIMSTLYLPSLFPLLPRSYLLLNYCMAGPHDVHCWPRGASSLT